MEKMTEIHAGITHGNLIEEYREASVITVLDSKMDNKQEIWQLSTSPGILIFPDILT
ncbi:MAG: hypothetical protein M1496_02720 [Candidatus Thermoplasmatota archaeon]|jgi:hypothetical protein|nr:hypothetical protein [Candidatus Thermoplasmatota archaeon]